MTTVIIFIFLFFSAFFSVDAWAVEKTSGDLKVTYTADPLFGGGIIWYPGLIETRSLTVENTGSETHTTFFRADNESETGNLSTAMFFRIEEGGAVHYGNSNSKTINNFWSNGEITLSNINGGSSTAYDLVITFWKGAGNEFQEKETSFDLVIGFEGTEDEIVVPVDTDGDDGDGDGGDGGVGGVAASPSPLAPVLTAAPPFFPLAPITTVEGVATESAEKPSETKPAAPEVKGKELACDWWHYLWWLPLVVQASLTFLYYRWLKKHPIPNWWLMPIILAGLSQIVHEILGCECVQSQFCPYYWVFNLFIFFSFFYFYWKLKQRD